MTKNNFIEEFEIKNFNQLINEVEAIKRQITPNEEKAKRKENGERLNKLMTI